MKAIVYHIYGSPDVLLTIMRDLMKAGKVTPVIDKRYRLSKVPEAIRYLETGHARGKVVVTTDGELQ